MRLLFSLAVITAAVVGCVSEVSAGLAFQLERTFTIPGLSGTIRQMKFNDVDGDGVPEVLANTSAKVVLYSISGDSIIFSILADPGYQVLAIELADVNRDSAMDIVAGLARFIDSSIFTPFRVFTAQKVVTKCFSGASFESVSNDSITGSTGTYVPFGTIAATDVDSDGLNELLVSLADVSTSEIIGLWSYWIEGKTICYRSFPNDVLWSQPIHVTRLSSMHWSDSVSVTLAKTHYDSYTELGADWGTVIDDFSVLDGAGNLQHLPGVILLNTCSDYGNDGWGNSVLCSGELDLDTANKEILLSQYSYIQCGVAGPIDRIDSLCMYHFEPPATCEEVWSKDYSGQNFTNYTYHPGLPGYFFAFSADTLVLFRGVDGSVHSELTDVPEGTRYWDYPFGDGIPRLVVTNGHEVSFYQLDVATDAGDEPEKNLPRSFVLGQPYPIPFNAELTIPITMSESWNMTVDVFNIQGERVARLHDGRGKAGENLIRWDATGVSSGIYLIRAQSSGETRTVKAVLLK